MPGIFQPVVLTRGRVGPAYAIAVTVDVAQFLLGPLGWAGADEILDLVAMIRKFRQNSYLLLRLASAHGKIGGLREPVTGAEMSALDRITVDPAVCGGRPCIRGLRIRVKDVLDLLAAGASHDEILADYPYLEPDDIAAVLSFAARQNDHPVLRSA